MKKYRVTIKFKRKNVKGVEEDSERFVEGFYPDAITAEIEANTQVMDNEPDLIEIYGVSVEVRD